MCLQCDGYSFEQAMLAVDLKIRTYGWQLTQVTDTSPWSYTIGLPESYGHPELMMIGVGLDTQSAVIRKLVSMVETTGRIDTEEVEAHGLTLVEVHRSHLRGDWFGTWSNHYGHLPPAGTFLQIVPPPEWFCECHTYSTPRLDRPNRPRGTGTRTSRRQR
jgi:hypothetical protein